MNQEQRRKYLIEYLEQESPEEFGSIPADQSGQKDLLRGLLNVRPARPASDEFLKIQDEYLQAEIAEAGIFDASELQPLCGSLCLWQGDITTIKCDAIVNAANSGLTGCWIPNHKCIDNCIHTFAGVQLRLDCNEIIEKQGYTEPFGTCQITSAYNLPCKHVLHTVGPIVQGELTDEHRELLASCYKSCLQTAAEHGLKSVAFCCISTGVFCFPNEEAAKIAIKTCQEFTKNPTSIEKIIFNVFLDKDKKIYERLLRDEKQEAAQVFL
ncbi:MAG: protein-ADP-ribose hydrolase [Phoenicibacter congonensis]|uniref:Protein-ADP-ribose hydrolase n=1 Tax=Phoenicibacter congonensis TaxID=1944646 RepID=A0AA43U606_9ACTN|nr:protein-ADP-ribose hydrolase [Phoenicibacter congonensis]